MVPKWPTLVPLFNRAVCTKPEVDLYGRVADDGAVSGAARVCPAAVVGRFIVTVQVLV